MTKLYLPLFLVTVSIIQLLGCDSKPTPAEDFNAKQGSTDTPLGGIVSGSAIDNPDGSITFEVDSDIKLKTTPIYEEHGTKYSTPIIVD